MGVSAVFSCTGGACEWPTQGNPAGEQLADMPSDNGKYGVPLTVEQHVT